MHGIKVKKLIRIKLYFSAPYLNPERNYQVILAPENRIIDELSGKQLSMEGFRVILEEKYAGTIFEVRAAD